MQDPKRKDFQDLLKEYGYEPVRNKGSHTIYECKRTLTNSISVPTSKGKINGALAGKLIKKIEKFDSLGKEV
jgi:predicted RNA binding protein YcfA (HicA-like mRNA interferase family)